MAHRVFVSLILVLMLLTGCDFFNKGAEEYLQQARQLHAEGDLQASIIEYKNALQAEPEHAQARWELGLIYLQTGDGASAEKEITRAKSLNSRNANADSFPVEVPLAEALMLQGDYRRLVDEVKIEPYLGPGEKYALHAMRAKAYLMLNKAEKAREIETALTEMAPEANETLLVRAYIKGIDQQPEAATKLLQKVVARDDSNSDAWLHLGEMELAQGNFESATQAFRKVVALSPFNTYAYYQLGLTAISTDDIDLANQSVQEIIKRAPKNPLARQLQGLIYMEKGEYESAQTAFEEVVKADNRFAPALYFAGISHLMQDHYEQSASYFESFLSLNSNHTRARQLFATTLFQLQRFDDIPRLLEPLVKSKVADARTLQLLGASYLRMGELDKGLTLVQRAADLAPETAAAQYHLAGGLLMAGESEKAMQQLQKTLELAPEFSQARNILVIGHLSKGEGDKALKIADEAISETPDSVDAYLLKLMVLQHNKDYSQAEQLLEIMQKKFPDALVFHLAQGSFLADRGQIDDARAAFKRVLSQDNTHVGALMRLARLERAAGNSAAMGKWLADANNVDPAALMPALAYAEYLFKTGQAEPALRVLGQVTDADRDNQYYLSLLGQIQLSTGEIQQAVTSYKKLTQVAPNSVPARLSLARVRMVDNDKEGAFADLEVALKLDPKHLQAKVQKTQLQFDLGDKRGANFSLNELLQDYPDSSAVLTLQGWMALRERDFVLAEKAYEKVWQTLPSPGVATEYSRALIGLGKREQAVELLETTLNGNKENIDLLFALATVYDAEKEGEKSIPLYEKVIKVRPKNYVALNNLAWLLKESKPRRALELANRAHEAAPKMPAVLDTYGLILLEQGQSEKAERILEEASSLSDFDPSMSYHYAQSLIENGKSVKAKRVLQNALAQSTTFPEAKEAQKLLNSL